MDIKSRYDWVDAFRGYAIILVILLHTSIRFAPQTEDVMKFTILGAFGVQLFFIMSSFTLFNSYSKRSLIDGINTVKFFFIRRFFRIAPAYYLIGIWYIILSIITPRAFIYEDTGITDNPIDWFKTMIGYLFLNGLYLPAISYLPPGAWSISVEMMFYLTLPILFLYLKDIKITVLALFSAMTISYIINHILVNFNLVSDRVGLYFWFPNQFPIFIFGVLLFHVRNKFEFKKYIYNCLIVISIILFIYFRYMTFFTYPSMYFQQVYIYSFILFLFVLGVSKTNNSLIINKYIREIGKVSFSMYLIHFRTVMAIYIIVKYIQNFIDLQIQSIPLYIIISIICIIITFYISKITYKYIELRGIEFGNKIINNKEKNNENRNKI